MRDDSKQDDDLFDSLTGGSRRRRQRSVFALVDSTPEPDLSELTDLRPEAPPRDPENKTLTMSQRAFLKDCLAEVAMRRRESLRLFKPMPQQEKFCASLAPERLVRGGNRGGKCQPIDEPVLTPTGWRPIGDLRVGDRVIGGDGLVCRVTGVYPQGERDVYRLSFDDGASTRSSMDHLWRVKIGKQQRFGSGRTSDQWSVLTLKEITDRCGFTPKPIKAPVVPVCVSDMDRKPVPVDPYLLGILIGDGCLRTAVAFTSADPEIVDSVRRGIPAGTEVKHKGRYDYAIVSPCGQANPLLDAIRDLKLFGKYSHEKFVPDCYLFNSVSVRLSILQGLMDSDGSVNEPRNGKPGGSIEYSTTSQRLACNVVHLVRSLGGKATVSWRQTSYTHKGERKTGRVSARIRIRMPMLNPFSFRLKRKWERFYKRDAVTPNRILRSVEPAGKAECVCIAVDSPDHTYVTKDYIVTHNTLIAAVEVARAVTGQDPHGKYPASGRCMIVGWDLNHCAEVQYKKLFRPGAFKVIKDPVTKEFRSFDPTSPWDAANEHKAQDAPPLIPKRFIEDIAWEDKRKGIPKQIKLKNGWELTFYTSKGDPPQGIDIDLAWFDEEIQSALWYRETSARLLDRHKKLADGSFMYPRFIWSATPLAGTEQLLELKQRADEEKDQESPAVEDFLLGLLDNTHISVKAKNDFIKKLANPDEYNVRILGDFAITGTRVYSEFAPRGAHRIDSFVIPADWTRYCAIDPGRQVCAVLFCAVPPPSCLEFDPTRVYFYRELYIKRCDAVKFAEEMKRATEGEVIQEWWIDHHAGRMTEIASGKTPEEQYSAALKGVGVKSVRNQHGFSWGADNLEAGILSVRSGLTIRSDTSTPRFAFMVDLLPNLAYEMSRYSYKRTPNGIVTDQVIKLNDHLADCLRYLAQANLRWVRPKAVEGRRSYTAEALKRKREKAKRESGWGGSIKLG